MEAPPPAAQCSANAQRNEPASSSAGIHAASSADRTLATILLRGNPAQFRSVLERLGPSYKRIPRHFQEAMVFYGIRSGNVDASVVERYSAFVEDLQFLTDEQLIERYRDTAFIYLQYAL